MNSNQPWILKLSEKSFLKRIDDLAPHQRQALLLRRMKADPEFFARQALAHHCRLPFAPVHRLLFRWHAGMGAECLARRRGRRHALAAPRGSAKSTIASLVLVLHDLLFHRERYILLLSSTERQARQRLRSIRNELEEPLRGLVKSLGAPQHHYTAGSLQYGAVRIDAYGAGTEIRGISEQGYRPTKIILDDAEASSAARSVRSRERLAAWFAEIVEHLGDVYTNIIAIGTILHEKSLLSTLLQRPDFEGKLVRSIETFSPRDDLWNEWRRLLMDFSDERRRETARRYFEENREALERHTVVLWKEKEDYEDLMAQLALQGRRAFYQEKQNMPLGREDALFDADAALRGVYTNGELAIESAGRPVRRYTDAEIEGRRFGYLDAALGKGRRSGRGDFSALATVMLLPDGSLFLEDLWARRCPPSEQVDRLFARHEHAPFEALAIEGTGFQELLLLPIEEERKRRRSMRRPAEVPIRVVHPKKNKFARIASLEPLVSNGTLALAPGLAEEFWEEFAAYPGCEHDDALDAAAGAVELALAALPGAAPWESLPPPARPLKAF